MKRKVSVISFLLSVIFCFSTFAESRSSTTEEFRVALSYSVNALSKTDNYITSLIKGQSNFDDLLKKQKICEKELKLLENIHSKNLIHGSESHDCIHMAIIILQERNLALSWLINSIYASAKGDYSLGEQYSDKARKYMNSSDALRQKFKNTYGY